MAPPQVSFLVVLTVLASLHLDVEAVTRAKLINNGYEGVVVGISPDIPEAQGPFIIDAVKNLIKESSKNLFAATHNKAFFRDVKIVIPMSWTNTDVDDVAVNEKYLESDIRIDRASSQYRHQPYTRQTGGCGEAGEFIHLTPEYLTDNFHETLYGPREKTLTIEWAKFRWGVFDEYGYRGDQNYPLFYRVPQANNLRGRTDVQESTDLQLNVCANNIIGGTKRNWYDRNAPCVYDGEGYPNDDCYFYVDDQQTATTSLMAYMYIFSDTVTEFCDEHTHNKHVETKQNAFCNGASVWEVMRRHEDFINNPNPSPSAPPDPVIQVVQESHASFAVVLDYSGSMDTNNRMERLQKTAQQWVLHEVALFSSVAIIRFDSVASELAPLTKIRSDADRQALASSIHVNNGGGTSIGAGLRMAVNMLDGHNNKNVLLITDGEENESPMVNDVIDEVVSGRVCVITIALGENAEQSLEKLADLTGCTSYTVNDDDVSNALDNAFEVTTTRQPSVDLKDRSIKMEETLKIETISSSHSGEFIVDSTIGKDLKFHLKTNSASHIVSEPYLIKPDGTIVRNAVYDDIGLVYTITVPLAEEGTWGWSVGLSGDSSKYIQATIDSKQRDPNEDPIITSVSFNAPGNEIDPHKQKVKIYATVTKGNNPVVGASVKAFVTPPGISMPADEYTLRDNGKGADSLKGDGVYSCYMTKFYPSEGRYSIKALVKAGKNTRVNNGLPPSPSAPSSIGRRRRRSIDNSRRLPQVCCGSEVPINEDTATPTGNFTRISSGSSIKIVNPPLADQDILGPCKVSDLSVTSLNKINGEAYAVSLAWTTPGDDLDEGTASKYVFRMSDDRQDLTDDGFDKAPDTSLLQFAEKDLTEADILQPSGINVVFNVTSNSIFKFHIPYYVGLKAMDEAGNLSPVSNIATFFLEEKLELPEWADDLIIKLKNSTAKFDANKV